MTSVGPMFDAMGPEARRQMQAIVQAFHRVPVREFERLEFATDADYWRVLSETYHLTDHAYGDADRWASLLSSSRPGRDEAMRPSELAALAALGDPLTVFRGYSGEWDGWRGFSWTPERAWADVYGEARRDYGLLATEGGGWVAEGRVDRADVCWFRDWDVLGTEVVVRDPAAVRLRGITPARDDGLDVLFP